VRLVAETETTVVWSDGEVWRTDRFGRTRQMPDTLPTQGWRDAEAAKGKELEEPVEL